MAEQPGSENAPEPISRVRLVAALGLALLLAVIVAAVLILAGSSEKHSFEPAPERCVDGWNDDPAAVSLGLHQYSGHGYYNVQVITLSGDGSRAVPENTPGALCAIAFAASTLDAEVAAAALVQLPKGWSPLSDLQPSERLAELQATAGSDYNATLRDDGTIEAL